jgi:hypothetical protein
MLPILSADGSDADVVKIGYGGGTIPIRIAKLRVRLPVRLSTEVHL